MQQHFGVLLAGLLPVAWLFSASSRSLGFITTLHFRGWALCLAFGCRFLGQAVRLFVGADGLFLWLLLFSLVSLQMATVMRPLLWRAPGTSVVVHERLFFLEHLGQVLDPPTRAAPAGTAGTARTTGCQP